MASDASLQAKFLAVLEDAKKAGEAAVEEKLFFYQNYL